MLTLFLLLPYTICIYLGLRFEGLRVKVLGLRFSGLGL